jgi:hypothetical protein
LYYGLSDVSNTTATDVLRRVPLAGGAEQTVVPAGTSGYPATPTLLAYDAATDRIFVVNAFNNAQSIVAVNAATGAVSPFVAPAGTGSTNSQITGLVVGGGFLYYGLSDVSNTTFTDVLRRVPLAGGAEQTVVPAGTSGYPATPTLLAYDAATNRIFVVNAFNNAQSIVAVNAATGAVSPFVTPAGTGSTNSQITGLVVGTPLAVPTVTTAAATSITSTSAVLGGNVTADGGGTVTDRGVVYSSSNQTPAIGGAGVTQNANNSGTGSFSEPITGLTASTTYYVRAYATNAAGTSYGTVSSFTTAAPVGGTTVVTNVSCNGGTNGAINLTPTGGVAPYTFVWSPGGQTTEDRTGLAAGTYTVTITDATGATGTVSATVTQPSALTAATSQTNIACNGAATGVASVSPIGGTSPYTYRWSTGATTQTITGLAAGSYSVVITDANGCTLTRSFIITQPSALTATTSQTNVTTNGGNNGSATITVSGGTPGYTYSWSPNVSTTATASNLSAGTYTVTVTDANGCTIARTFTITQPAFTATAQPVTVQLDANGTGTLNASSVNNGSTGSGTLTYTIQKIAFGYIPESTTPLTLTTPNGSNFTQIRFASYGTPNNNGNGNYSLGSCNAANSLSTAQNAYVGRSSGSMYASNTDTRNNPVLGDPCGGTPKALAVQAAYSADAASLAYDCTEAGKTQYVLLTVTNGTNTSTAVAQVTVTAPPTATLSSVSPTSAQRGTPVTVAGTNLSGVSSVTVNGATANISNVTATGFTFVVPNTATFGPGSLVVATPCAQTLTNPFTVVAPALTATVSGPASPTSTAPLPFSVTFSQSVGSTFTAADVTVTGGTLTSGSFSGSGAGPYAFTVTPSGTGTVSVSLAANVAQDANNTGNSASNTASVQFQAPTITVAPAALPNGQQGTAYSQALSATGGTAPYTYAITAGALPTGLTLTNGTIAGTPTTNGTFNFTVTATDASAAPGPYSGSQAYSLVITAPAITATTWTGTISTDWFTAGNWTQGVPSTTIDATIPTAPSGGRFPNISAGTASVRNLTFNSGATLTQSGGTLAIAANLTNNGTFLPTSGTVVLGNTAFSNIFGASSIRFWNLTVGTSGAQLSTSIGASVQRLLTLNGTFATNGNSFVLESNNTLTALVVNNNGNVVNGTVTVQRAIDPSVNPGLGYRHYSSPVSNSTVGDLATSGFTPVVNPAFNTVASPYTITPYPTVYGYDDSRLTLTNNLDMFDKGYLSPSALSDPLAVGRGYTVNIAASELVDFQGTLNNGDLSLNLTSTRNTYPADGGWQFLGNPYPAPLDYSRVAAADRSGLESAIYIYSSTSQYIGRYRVYVNGIGNPVVPLGQGFFARLASGNTTATMTFRNSHRLTAPNGTTLQRPAADPRPLVQLTLQGQGAALADEAYVYFENGATSGFEPTFDAEKLPNPTGLNLSTTQAGRQLSIDGQPELGTAQRVVPLAVGVPAAGTYTFTASQLLNLSTTPVYLRDMQTGALIDLRQQPSYQFTVSNAAALNTTRFALVFSPQQALATAPAALAEQVGLYPNPARTQVSVELPLSLSRQPVAATLLDALGRVVRQQVLPAGLATHALPLADLATGVYSLRLATEKGTVVKKLVVE